MSSQDDQKVDIPPNSPKCTALSLADGQKCDATAISAGGQFCKFHARQCFGLYKGYKRRNAQLDALVANPPSYLSDSRKKLASQNFSDVEDEKTIGELQQYLFRKYNLLDQVVRARKVHHKHFYALTMDYGHENYLNSLITKKRTVNGALQRCYQRMAHLAYEKQKWFQWAKECQTEEDQQRENEQKKIKREAALFRRRAKELERYMRQRRAKEDARRQEEFLQRAYEQSMAERSAEEDNGDDEDWDPIGEVLEDERDTYIALIKFCLWIDTHDEDDNAAEPSTYSAVLNSTTSTSLESDALKPPTVVTNEPSKSQSSKKNKKGKGKNKKPPQGVIEDQAISMTVSQERRSQEAQGAQPILVPTGRHNKRPEKEPDMAQIESRSDMRSRLIEGKKIKGGKPFWVGSNWNSVTYDRMPAIPVQEVNRLIDEVAEIKNFLLCRLLLRDPVLLPAAQKASSLDDFFNNPEVKTQELRDLCLKLEEPQLQDIRDACADFFRVDDEDSDAAGEEESSSNSEGEISDAPPAKDRHVKHPLPEIWRSKKEKQLKNAEAANPASRDAIIERVKQSEEEPGTKIDFGKADGGGRFKKANLRVKICGRNIYNYPKKGSMSRSGWFHFSLIAKDCSIWKSIELCKSWDEFFEVNVLSLHQYFPSPQWSEWGGDMIRHQYLQFGFIPYYNFDDAEKQEIRRNLSSRGHRGRVDYQIRNFMCAQIKRNDPISRRFIQYVAMQTSRMFILVRDGKTGELIVSPDQDELWLARILIGIGRDRRNSNVQTLRFVGEEFFEEMDRQRSFHLGFDDFYDVYIWSADPGVQWQFLHACILSMLCKTHRVRKPIDRWAIEAPILKTLTVDDSHWVRDIRKDETVQSIWDVMSSDTATFIWGNADGHETNEMPKSLIYTEADALEDAVLFPLDADPTKISRRYRSVDNALAKMESGRARDQIVARFVGDFDTDEEVPQELREQVVRRTRKRGNKKSTAAQEIEGDCPLESSQTSSGEDAWETDPDSGSEANSSHASLLILNSGSEALAIRSKKESAFDCHSDEATALEAAERILNSFGKGPERHVDMGAEFMVHIDLWKSKVFKNSWHTCDFETGAQQRWQEYLSIRSDAESDRALLFELALPCAQLLKFLNYHPETHLRVMKDARRAYSIISLFSSKDVGFFRTKRGSKYQNSRIFDQLRSKDLPDCRGFQSCRFREDSFYADLLRVQTASRGTESLESTLPLDWDICIRPKIAKLFSEGLICVSNVPPDHAAGPAFAAREGDRPLDLFFDFRDTIKDIQMPRTMINPYTITIDSLRQAARDFSGKSPEAKFALLRLWSAPHFYPFMLGYDNRDMSTFVDAIGRVWAWKFMPKDMAYSEYSVHKNMTARLEPLQRQLGTDHYKIKVRKDVVLVMGKDEEELLKLAAAATFSVQTQPWRLEIDFWKSFVNIDIKFLDGLQDEWWA